MPSAPVFEVETWAPAIAEAMKADVVAEALKFLAEMPAVKTAGIISKDGGTSDPETKTFADWLLAVSRKDVKRLDVVYHSVKGGKWLDSDDATGPSAKAALAEGSGTTGGYLVPPQFIADLLQVASEDAIVRPLAYKQPMSSRTALIPFLDQTTVPTAGRSAFFGGVVASWSGEAGALTETEPTFRLMELVAHKLAGYTLSSNEEVADSAIGLEQLLKTLFAKAINWYEDYAFLRGDGIAKPLGIQNSACAISVSRAGGANTFTLADAAKMLSRMLPSSSIDKLRWVMHPYVIPQMINLQVGSATGANWVTNLQDGLGQRLLGIPIKYSEKMAPLGTAFDVLLADFSYYVIGDRKALEVSSSEHYKFANDQMTWRFTYRVDGQPWLNNVITMADSTSTISPFVFLT